MGLIYKGFESISLKILLECGIKTTYKNRLHEYFGFIYYKIAKAIKWLFNQVKLEKKITYYNETNQGKQLCLELY